MTTATRRSIWHALTPRSAVGKRMFALSLLAPAATIVLLVILYPLFVAANMSLYDVRIFRGLDALTGGPNLWNYEDMAANPVFWRALRTSLFYVIWATGLSFLVGLGTAMLLNQQFRGRLLARILMVLPWPVPGVVGTLIFIWMFNASFGVINYLLMRVGVISSPISWFTGAETAFVAVVAGTVWKGYPFFTVMLLAGLQAVPHELYEAARVDGANPRQQFLHITLPALRPVIGIGLVISSMWTFREFETIYIMTGGGPSRATETLAIQIYQEAFQYLKMSYASSIGMVTLVISVLMTIFFLRFVAREFY
jgi:multiple sugar transport system permease protein